MIRFDSVTAENMILFPKVEVPLHQQGLVLVTGWNKDEKAKHSSNGAGKSALFELLPIALFDKTIRGGQKSDLALDCAKPSKLEAEFHVGKDHFKVVRTRKPNALKIFKNGKYITPRGGIPQARKLLKKIMPLSEDTYYSVVHITPHRTSQFIEGSPSSRYAYLADLLKLKLLDEARDEVTSSLSYVKSLNLLATEDYKKELKRLEKELPPAIDIKMLRKVLRRLKGYYETCKVKLWRVENLLDLPAETFQVAFRKQLFSYESLDRLYRFYEEKLVKIHALKSDLEHRQTLEGKLDTLVQLYKVPTNITEVEAYLSRLQRMEDLVAKFKIARELRELVLRETGIDIFTTDEDFYAQDLMLNSDRLAFKQGKLSAKIDSLKKEVVKLQGLLKAKNRKCPICSSPINQEKIAARIEALKKRISLYQRRKQKIAEELAKAQEKRRYLKAYYKARNALEAIPPDLLEKFKNDLPTFERSLLERKKVVLEVLEILKALKTLPKYSPDKLYKVTKAYKYYSQKVSTLELIRDEAENIDYHLSKLKHFKWKGESRQELIREKKRLRSTMERLQAIISKYDKIISLASTTNKQRSKILKRYEEVKHKLNEAIERDRQLRVLQDLYQLLGPKGVKKRIVNHYLNVFMTYFNDYASQLFRGLTLSYKAERGNLYITYKTKAKSGDIKTLSSGQKRRLSLALVAALMHVLPPSHRSNILILDEIDANVDKAGIARMNAFLPKLKEFYSSVFVISPVDDHFDCYDQHWQVIKEKGRSKLVK